MQPENISRAVHGKDKTNLNSAARTMPELLAPVGGWSQFYAALHSGADAVFLGLKRFNARGRAGNFTLDELRVLAPLAQSYGMKVLLTLNVVLKEEELADVIDILVALQTISIHALIVQDLGLAGLVRERFPALRLHASTQLAIHNLQGAQVAAKLGFKRTVLARELSFQELQHISSRTPREDMEFEAFCHGSLCYSYSGLCFFSGAEDARSGNRGECAYTCRKPYRITNEPGHGFLFSMKDLDSSDFLESFLRAGIDTLKIEGRKKDAQYVDSAVRLYRNELAKIAEANGLSLQARRKPTEKTEDATKPVRVPQEDLEFSFNRDHTSFFLKGRYHENVIDLSNPTHRGVQLGSVLEVRGRTIEFRTELALEKYDGLRIESAGESTFHAPSQLEKGQPPKKSETAEETSTLDKAVERYDNRVLQFSLRDFQVLRHGAFKDAVKADAGDVVRMQLSADSYAPASGDFVFKVRSNELKRHADSISVPPRDARLLPWDCLDLCVHGCLTNANTPVFELTCTFYLGEKAILSRTLQLDAEPNRSGNPKQDLEAVFRVFGDARLQNQIRFDGEFPTFLPKGMLKRFKQELVPALIDALDLQRETTAADAKAALRSDRPLSQDVDLAEASRFQIKVDRLELLDALAVYASTHPDFGIQECIFEPKRHAVPVKQLRETFATLAAFREKTGIAVRIALPTVFRVWDEPYLKLCLELSKAHAIDRFEVGNLGGLGILNNFDGFSAQKLDLASDFSLFALNSQATKAIGGLGVQRVCLSVEDDLQNLSWHLAAWPSMQLKPQAILYKDTPLFIAESCSLTALHNGCPGPKTCGYRSLEIEDDSGEGYVVAHESCRSIVYAKRAFSISEHQAKLVALGVRDFRIDFLTRPYSAEELNAVLDAVRSSEAIPQTHTANFLRTLL